MAWPCPCCGFRTLPRPLEECLCYICPVCFWVMDLFTAGPDDPSDCNNGLTLLEGRANYRRMGACVEGMLPYVRPPEKEELP